MAIAFPTTFASQSGNLAASTLDANFTYTGTLPSQATTITSVSYTLTGAETVLINAGATPYGATLLQITSALGVGTAAKLQTARTISTTGDVTYTSSGFDGTANVTGTATVVSASTSTPGKVQLAQASDVTAGTSTTLAVTPAGFAGSSSIANPGYYKFPGGMIMAWGTITTSGSATVTLTLPTTFTNASSYTVTFSQNNSSGGGAWATSASGTRTTTTLGVDGWSASAARVSVTFDYQVIGY